MYAFANLNEFFFTKIQNTVFLSKLIGSKNLVLISALVLANLWWILKAPPLNPWTYISRSSNKDPTEGH